MWDCTGADREASDLGPGARKSAAEKRYPDPLMPRTIACTLSLIFRAKGIPRRTLGTGVTRPTVFMTCCNLGIFCVGMLGETDDRGQLLGNKIWVSLWKESKSPILRVAFRERECSLHCRGQGRSLGN